MEKSMRVFLFDGSRQGGNIVDGAGFIVYVHDADKTGIFVYHTGQNFRQNFAGIINGAKAEAATACFQHSLTVEYGMMLGGGNNYFASGRGAKKRRIVAFGSAGGKNQFLGPSLRRRSLLFQPPAPFCRGRRH